MAVAATGLCFALRLNLNGHFVLGEWFAVETRLAAAWLRLASGGASRSKPVSAKQLGEEASRHPSLQARYTSVVDYSGRLRGIAESLAPCKLDFLLVTHLPNIRYLCGFTGSSAVLVITEKHRVLFTDGRYTAQARAEVRGARIRISPNPSLIEACQSVKTHARLRRRIGIEGEHLTVSERSRLAATLPSGFRLKDTPLLIEQARMVKDAEEIELIRAAVHLGTGLLDVAKRTIHPGVKEVEVAAEMEFWARRAGAERMSFDTIVASGVRSSLPHGRASAAPISQPGFVVCDFGVILAGYCSDMTRTLYLGSPNGEARQFYEAVREAQQAACEAVRPGVAVSEVDRAARNVLRKACLARYFTHSTGHGVGLEIHERPRIASGQTEILRPGMVITIEPGAYVPGKWGVRIEDMVVVTETGHEVLTPASKDLIIVA